MSRLPCIVITPYSAKIPCLALPSGLCGKKNACVAVKAIPCYASVSCVFIWHVEAGVEGASRSDRRCWSAFHVGISWPLGRFLQPIQPTWKLEFGIFLAAVNFLAVLNQPYCKFNVMQYHLTVELKKEAKRHYYFKVLIRVSIPRLPPVSARLPQA